MRVKVQVVIESDCGETEVIQELAQLQRDTLHPETLGLTLAEAKTVLQNVQRKIVEQQVSEYLEQQAVCSECGQKRLPKDNRSIVYRTLFGKLKLRGTRLFRCDCQPHSYL